MEERFCQSCGMPMGDTDELYGTEADGSKSTDYCSGAGRLHPSHAGIKSRIKGRGCTQYDAAVVPCPETVEEQLNMKKQGARQHYRLS